MSMALLDQASRLRMLMGAVREAPPVPQRIARMIAIASGKGGVGKTNVAANLAIVLARRALRVILVDADPGAANVDVVLNLRAPWNISHVIRGERRLDDATIRVEPGLRVVCGVSGLSGLSDMGPAERAVILDGLESLQSKCDILLLDCGAGISQNVLAFARAAHEAWIITTPEPTALTSAYALIKALAADRPPSISLLVNQVESIRQGRAITRRVVMTARTFLGIHVREGGQILRDECVVRAVTRREPVVRLYPRSPAATCLAALAERVAQGARQPARPLAS